MALDVGQQVSPGNHRFARDNRLAQWTMGVAIRGRVRITTSQSIVVEQTSMMLVAPFTAYKIDGMGEEIEEYYAIFDARPAWLRWMNRPQAVPGVIVVHFPSSAHHKEAQHTIREAMLWHWGGTQPMGGAVTDPDWRHEATMNVLERLVLQFGILGGGGGKAIDPRIRRATEYVQTHIRETIRVGGLASHGALSTSQLAHLFTNQLGQSPASYIELQRIRHAQDLIVTGDLPLHEVARSVGFENPYHFSKRFRARVRQSPREFRRLARESRAKA